MTLWPLFEELPGLGRRDRTRDRDIARGQHYRVASDDRSANPKKAANAKETGSSKTAKEMKHLETKRWLADAKGCVHQSAVSASPANFLALFSTAWNFADKQNEGCASIVYGGVVMSKDGACAQMPFRFLCHFCCEFRTNAARCSLLPSLKPITINSTIPTCPIILRHPLFAMPRLTKGAPLISVTTFNRWRNALISWTLRPQVRSGRSNDRM